MRYAYLFFFIECMYDAHYSIIAFSTHNNIFLMHLPVYQVFAFICRFSSLLYPQYISVEVGCVSSQLSV